MYVEAGAGFCGEVTVAVDGQVASAAAYVGYELSQRGSLRWRARVFGSLAVGGASPDVAYPYGLGVMSQTVGADFCLRASCVDTPVAVYHVMIPDCPEATRLVSARYVGHGEVFSLRGGRAMDDDFCWCHDSSVLISVLMAHL